MHAAISVAARLTVRLSRMISRSRGSRLVIRPVATTKLSENVCMAARGANCAARLHSYAIFTDGRRGNALRPRGPEHRNEASTELAEDGERRLANRRPRAEPARDRHGDRAAADAVDPQQRIGGKGTVGHAVCEQAPDNRRA